MAWRSEVAPNLPAAQREAIQKHLAKGMVKVALHTLDGGEIMVAESVWAYPVGGDRYRIENNPLSPVLSYGNVVTAPADDEGFPLWQGEIPHDGGEPTAEAA